MLTRRKSSVWEKSTQGKPAALGGLTRGEVLSCSRNTCSTLSLTDCIHVLMTETNYTVVTCQPPLSSTSPKCGEVEDGLRVPDGTAASKFWNPDGLLQERANRHFLGRERSRGDKTGEVFPPLFKDGEGAGCVASGDKGFLQMENAVVENSRRPRH